MSMWRAGNIVPRFRVRTLMVFVALAAIGIWAGRIVWEGPERHWKKWMLGHADTTTRKMILSDIDLNEFESPYGRLFPAV